MIRASRFVLVDGAEHVFLESYLGQNVSVLEIDLALSSLSLACQTVSDEVEVMRSEMVAGEYLIMGLGYSQALFICFNRKSSSFISLKSFSSRCYH